MIKYDCFGRRSWEVVLLTAGTPVLEYSDFRADRVAVSIGENCFDVFYDCLVLVQYVVKIPCYSSKSWLYVGDVIYGLPKSADVIWTPSFLAPAGCLKCE